MIVPSIDLQSGRAVQLVGGETLRIDAGDPTPLMQRFARVGEVAVIDLDAARGEGSNGPTLEALCAMGRVRVGGGIRTVERARELLDAGADRIIIGTAATPEFLSALPRERLIAAVDARDGEVVDQGWRRATGRGVLESVEALRPYVSGFLVTSVEREGRLGGADLELAKRVVEAAGDARVTIAGGVTRPEEIAALDAMGADAQVGMALYGGELGLAEAFAAPLTSDRPDGLFPTVVCDTSGRALGLAWSSARSLEVALERGVGAYESRRRGLWVKGETSGATQELVAADVDCDRDVLRFTVRQRGPGMCHTGDWSCFGAPAGLARLERTIAARAEDAPAGSYTARLLADDELLGAKLTEEAGELAAAATREERVEEAADVLYFTRVALERYGASFADVERVLDARAGRVTRRPGNAKPQGVSR